jgi:hypothetical protein
LAEEDLGEEFVLALAATVHSGVWGVDSTRSPAAGGLFEVAVDEAFAHEGVQVEADGVGVDAESFGEFGDAERGVAGAEGVEHRAAM